MWLWDHVIEFVRWQHHAMMQCGTLALGWHAIEFGQRSAILEFYLRFRFRPYYHHHRSRHVILHQSPKFYPNRTAHGRKKASCWFSRWRIFAILDFRGPIMGSLKSPCTTSYIVNRDHSSKFNQSIFILLKFARTKNNIAFLHFGDRQTNRQINRQTDKQMDKPTALSRSSCRERRLNKLDIA